MNTHSSVRSVELWFDFSCPYAYLASRRARVLADRGVRIDWRPMLLGGVFRGIGAGDGPMATLSVAKADHNLRDMHRWAARFDVPFRMPAGHPMRTVRALRTLLGLPHSRWPAAIDAIYAAYWQRGEDVTSPAVIESALAAAGIPDDELAAASAGFESDAIKDELRRRTDEAIALGIFGAPAWIFRDGDTRTLVWGQDRFPWLDAIVDGWRIDDASAAPPGGHRPVEVQPTTRAFDVYFDISSPFAYLGLTQLPRFVAAGAKVQLRPILLGGLFRDIGQANVPLFEMNAPKQRYTANEMLRWSRWWGVPFEMPKQFPQRTIAAQRLILVAEREGRGIELAIALGRAMWAEQRNLEDPATLAAIATTIAPERATTWLAAIATPEIKDALIANTSAAKAAKVFGVPTFVVGDQLFWGQDRLDLVAAALVTATLEQS